MKWGKCDFKDLQKFQKQIEKLANSDIDKFCKEVAKELTARLLAKVIKKTPVGNKPEQLTSKPKTIKVAGNSGKSKTFLSKEGSILAKYWAGYMGGTLRRGWTARTEAEARNGTGKTVSEDKIKSYVESVKILKFGSNYSIIVENPVRYAEYVEKGHRQEVGRFVPQIGKKLKNGWVDGVFMLTVSEKELQGQVDRIVRQKLERFLGECFRNG